MFGFGRKKEARQAVTQSETNTEFLQAMGLVVSGQGPSISFDQALSVPAVWAAVNFLSGTIAGLPLQVFDKTKDGRKKVSGALANSISKAVNPTYTSFQWRYDMFSTGVFSEGRSVTYFERNGAGFDMFPIIGAKAERLDDGSKLYVQELKGGGKKYFAESDVIDITYMLKSDLLTPRSPVKNCMAALAKAYHANDYGNKLFANGGMPSWLLQGPFGSDKSASRASADIEKATKEAAQRGGNVLAVPIGHKLDPLGSDPEKMQLVETQRFAVQEVARVFQLPPTFVQDLSNGTFSNTEQQDLQLVKHTVKRWCEQIEAEMNLKLFGRNSKRYVEFNLDGLMRGDFKTTMDGFAVAIQSGQMTPDETREKRNLMPKTGGDQLFIQGATVPLATQGQENDAT